MPLRNISDTALWVAVYRADETERADAIFIDNYARGLAGKRGESIVQAMQSGRKNSWSFVARTYLFDKIIQDTVKNGVQQVINLGILPLINAEMGSLLIDANSALVFAPEDGEDFFRLFGWKPVASHSKFKTAALLNRLPDSLLKYANKPEPEGPKGDFPWSGVCLFKNIL